MDVSLGGFNKQILSKSLVSSSNSDLMYFKKLLIYQRIVTSVN